MMKALLLFLMAGKIGKFLLTGGTMLISVVTYAWVYGWRYAVGLVGLIFVHEMGHYLAARQVGLKVGAPCFIPFVGAWIELKEQPMNAEVEAFVGMAGPLLGTAGAFLCFLVAENQGSRMLMAIAYSGFMLNLFNLIPLSPLDGGRIVAVISPKIWYVGIPILIGLFLWRPSPMLLLLAVLAVPKILDALKNRDFEQSPYYIADGATRLRFAAQYLLLAGFLAITVFSVHEQMTGGPGLDVPL
ncbi:MAG: site-2 protease family protein [Betaproteobacteria bacterium]|jgi:Zn-dependent protease|nr:site-2 protease family protein [Betaproteobacteria bacterium]HMV20004.1 site-2 protease family protein [Rhodocyclaceae bacterium]HMW76452.1 site-2 protease family protein [Rhodocyclaceae bacterium]HNE43070.1 site-2 protease family protein [Rhodocyclaceae bacterium]HNM21668.1 site-2 protease family protein [Rhodocyclaceae bacterium]